MIEEKPKTEESPKRGFLWSLQNKGKIFLFIKTDETDQIYGRVVGFAEDISGGFFFIKTKEEPEGKTIMMSSAAEIKEVDEVKLKTLEKQIPKAAGDKFEYYMALPDHNIFYYNQPVLTPVGRAETR